VIEMDAEKVIKYPVSTEKTLRTMETENKLLFVVANDATKSDIKTAVESMFKVKVLGINTFIIKRKKRAYVKLDIESPAIDIATQLGMV
jgi:large subunit ribosomal protein L23